MPRLPRKMQAQRPGAHTGRQGTPGRTSDPLESLKCRACHAKCKHRTGAQGSPPGRASGPGKYRGSPRDPGDARAYIRPLGEPEVARLPRQAQRTPGRTSDPLESLKCRACHAKCKHRGPEPKGRQDARRQGVHQTPWRA